MGFFSKWFGIEPKTKVESEKIQGLMEANNIHGDVNYNFYEAGNKPPKALDPEPPVIDKDIIIDFDLEKLETAFRNLLRPKIGPFACSLDICPHIYNQYVLERLKKELYGKCKRAVHPVSIFLKRDDLDQPDQPLGRLIKMLGGSVYSWLDRNPPEALMVSVINNNGIPADEILHVFWERILADIGGFLEDQGHTLVILWISPVQTPVALQPERFCCLELPKVFDPQDVKNHFKQRLKTCCLDDRTITDCIEEILEYGCEFSDTYGQMAETVKKLKEGGMSPYAY